MQAKKKMSPLLAVFITVFIDMLGIGIIIPITPSLILSGDHSILSPDITQHTRNIMYGFLAATFPFFQFFGAPILGTLADRHGRKKILQISLVGTFIGYVLFAFAIHTKLVWLLYFSRALPGFTGGNVSIVMAALADVSKPEEKAKNFGIVGMAFGLGFILGPTIGGILSSHEVVSWFNPATPLMFTALLTAVNMFYVYKQFPETFKPVESKEISLLTGVRNLKKAIRLVNMRIILLTIFLQAFGWSFFMQFNQVYLLKKFHFNERQIGMLFGYIGIWIALTQGGITRSLSKKFAPPEILKVSLICLAVAILIVLLPQNVFMLYMLNPFVAIFQGLTQPNQISIVSSLASKENQGEILGIQQSLQSIAFTVPPIIAGFLLNFDIRLPIIVSAVMTLCAWLVFFFNFKESAKSKVHVSVE
jgi:DHA1 family tetracycline resistance protein-like MFS transporter